MTSSAQSTSRSEQTQHFKNARIHKFVFNLSAGRVRGGPRVPSNGDRLACLSRTKRLLAEGGGGGAALVQPAVCFSDIYRPLLGQRHWEGLRGRGATVVARWDTDHTPFSLPPRRLSSQLLTAVILGSVRLPSTSHKLSGGPRRHSPGTQP